MKVKLADLEIQDIIIHPVRRYKDANGSDLPKQTPSKTLSKTSTAELEFLQEKIAETARHAQPIRASQLHVKNGNQQPQRILNLLNDSGDLVQDSIKMVADLAIAQDKQKGHDYLLLVGVGKCKKTTVVIMFTMQGENGIQAIEEEGKPIELKEIKNLVLNKKARLDKMVAFELDGKHTSGIIEDSVMRGGAQYFLGDFLGHEPVEKSWRHTQQFYKAVQATINSPIVTAADKLTLTAALYAEIRSPGGSIDISEFQEKHVKAAYRPEFEKQLIQRDLKVADVITKDTKLIENDLKAVTLELTSDIVLRLGEHAPKDAVKAMHDDSGDYLKVKGKIKRVGKATKSSKTRAKKEK